MHTFNIVMSPNTHYLHLNNLSQPYSRHKQYVTCSTWVSGTAVLLLALSTDEAHCLFLFQRFNSISISFWRSDCMLLMLALSAAIALPCSNIWAKALLDRTGKPENLLHMSCEVLTTFNIKNSLLGCGIMCRVVTKSLYPSLIKWISEWMAYAMWLTTLHNLHRLILTVLPHTTLECTAVTAHTNPHSK
jgi:hypothetical protein